MLWPKSRLAVSPSLIRRVIELGLTTAACMLVFFAVPAKVVRCAGYLRTQWPKMFACSSIVVWAQQASLSQCWRPQNAVHLAEWNQHIWLSPPSRYKPTQGSRPQQMSLIWDRNILVNKRLSLLTVSNKRRCTLLCWRSPGLENPTRSTLSRVEKTENVWGFSAVAKHETLANTCGGTAIAVQCFQGHALTHVFLETFACGILSTLLTMNQLTIRDIVWNQLCSALRLNMLSVCHCEFWSFFSSSSWGPPFCPQWILILRLTHRP